MYEPASHWTTRASRVPSRTHVLSLLLRGRTAGSYTVRRSVRNRKKEVEIKRIYLVSSEQRYIRRKGVIHHIYINCWLPVYRWSVMDKQVTSTPPIPGNGGGGGSGYLYLHYWPPVDWEPAINVDMVIYENRQRFGPST